MIRSIRTRPMALALSGVFAFMQAVPLTYAQSNLRAPATRLEGALLLQHELVPALEPYVDAVEREAQKLSTEVHTARLRVADRGGRFSELLNERLQTHVGTALTEARVGAEDGALVLEVGYRGPEGNPAVDRLLIDAVEQASRALDANDLQRKADLEPGKEGPGEPADKELAAWRALSGRSRGTTDGSVPTTGEIIPRLRQAAAQASQGLWDAEGRAVHFEVVSALPGGRAAEISLRSRHVLQDPDIVLQVTSAVTGADLKSALTDALTARRLTAQQFNLIVQECTKAGLALDIGGGPPAQPQPAACLRPARWRDRQARRLQTQKSLGRFTGMTSCPPTPRPLLSACGLMPRYS